jgi:hypothetical protein
MDSIDTKKLSSILKMLEKNNITLFKMGELEIHRVIVEKQEMNKVTYERATESTKEIDEALYELQEIDDENLLITDPEEYERRQLNDV